MFCPSCGKEIPDIAKFCPICGTGFAVSNEQSVPASVPETEPVVQTEVVPAPAYEPVSAPVEESVSAVQPEATVEVQAEQYGASGTETAPEAQAAQYQPAPVYAAEPEATPETQTAQYQPAPQYAAAEPAFAAPQYYAAPVAAPEKKLNLKLIGIIAAAVVLILLIVLIAALAGNAGGSLKYIGTWHNYFTNDDTAYIFYGDKLISEVEVDLENEYDDIVRTARYSADYSVYAVNMGDGSLYLFDGNKPYVVAEENVADFKISRDGKTLVYLIDDDGDRTLNFYRGKESVEIAELEYPDAGDYSSYNMSYIVSPDGSVVIYTQYDKDGEYITYAYKGGESFEIGDDLYPHYVTAGGKIAYLEDEDKDRLYVYKDLTEEIDKLNNFGPISKVSTDHNTIIYWDNKDETYMVYSPSMDKPIELIDENFYMVTASHTTGAYDSFDDMIITTSSDDNIYRFVLKNGKYEKTKLASGVDDYMLSSDGKKLAYTKNGSLYIINNVKAGKPDAVKIFKDMKNYSGLNASDDLKYLYFLDEDGNLMCSKGKEGDAVEIADDDVYRFIVTANGTCIYLYDFKDKNGNGSGDDGDTAELYYSVQGKDAVQVSEPDEAYSVSRRGNYIFARIDDELYVSKDGKKFNLTEADLG